MKYGNHSVPNGTYTRTDSFGRDRGLQIAADVAQHLELERLPVDVFLFRIGPRPIMFGSCVAMAGYVPCWQQNA
jgi:hypothetical protein